MTTSNTVSSPHDIKPVLFRFRQAMHERVQVHKTRISSTIGGARVTFSQAALHLMQSGADAYDEQA